MKATTYEIAGAVRLEVRGADQRTAEFVRAQLDPYGAVEPGGEVPDVVVDGDGAGDAALLEIARSAGDGLVTASDGVRFHVLHDGRSCIVPAAPGSPRATFAPERGFPLPRIFGRLVRPVLQLGLLRHGAVAVHASSVELEGCAVLFAGWSESGKTETALAFAERGARFLSDKWTVVRADGTAAAFPIRVGVRRWTLEYLPRLRASLPLRARAQLAAGRIATAALDPLRLVPAVRTPLAVLDQAVELAGRVALGPRQIRAAYGQEGDWSARFGALVLLTTVPGPDVTVAPADGQEVARRLAHSAAFERRDLADLYRRRRFALRDAEAADPVDSVARREEILLGELLATVPVIDVRAPFPVDPRRVAGAIAECL